MDKKAVRQEFNEFYQSKISPEKESGIKEILRDYTQSSEIKQRLRLFDIACSHESKQCQQWAKEYIRTFTLPDHIADFLKMWIHHPHPNLKQIASEFVDRIEVQADIELRTATLLLLDRENEAQLIDPRFEKVELFIQSDPSIFAPIAERISKIKKREFQRVVSDRAIIIDSLIEKQQVYDLPQMTILGLERSLRGEDWSSAWQILKNSSFITITEYLSVFKLSDWLPEQAEDFELFDFLLEYIGSGGWQNCSDILQETINQANYRYKGVNFEVAEESFHPISFQQELSTLTTEKEYLEGAQKKYARVKTSHTDLLYITYPAFMDVDFNLTGISAIISPISQFTTKEYNWINEIIKRLENSEDFYERKALKLFLALKKVAEHQAKKRFQIKLSGYNHVETFELPEDKLQYTTLNNNYTIGFDFGNNTTVISCMDRKTWKSMHGKDILINPDDPAFQKTEDGLFLPSMIHYSSGGKKLIGFEAESFRNSSETFILIKRSLRRGWSTGIKVEERRIKAPEALGDFIHQLTSRLNIHPERIYKVGFTAPVDAPTLYKDVLRDTLAKAFRIPPSVIESIDEATAAIMGLYDSTHPNIPILVVDIGGGTTDTSTLTIDVSSPTSHIFSRDSGEIGGSDIEAIAFDECRAQIGLDFPKTQESILKFKDAKHEIVDKGQMTPLKLNDNIEPISFSLSEINSWLIKAKVSEHFTTLIENTISFARRSGSGEIKQIVLTGGGSKWPLFYELCRGLLPEIPIIHKPNTFAVALGAIRVASGFSIQTRSSYPIGFLNFQNQSIVFHTLFPQGTQIPSQQLIMEFIPEETDVTEIEFDVRRLRQKEGGERFLLYGKDGVPHMKLEDTYTIFEPLQRHPVFQVRKGRKIIQIDDRGRVLLKNLATKQVSDLGSVL